MTPIFAGRARGAVWLALPFLAFGLGAWPGAVAVAPGDLVVNEVDYDNPGTDDAEFIELKNTTGGTLSLTGLTVVLVNGSVSPGAVYDRFDLPSLNLAAGDYFVVGAPTVPGVDLVVTAASFIQNGAPDAIAVVLEGPNSPADDLVIDAVSYEGDTTGGPGGGGSWTEGSGSALDDSTTIAFQGLSRHPDGTDSGVNNVDLSRRCISPGQVNLTQSTSCSDPAGTATATPAGATATATTAGSATATNSPPTATPPTATPTPELATATDTGSATATVPPPTTTATSAPATATSPAPTPTPLPPSATATSAPPTTTQPPSPSATSVPPTATAPAPTATQPPSPTAPPPTAIPSATSVAGPPTAPPPSPTATPISLAVEVVDLRAVDLGGVSVLSWRTLSEVDHAGWIVYRGLPGHWHRLHSGLLPARGQPLAGAVYAYRIAGPPDVMVWLADVDTRGRVTLHGPVVPASFHPSQPGVPR